MAKRFRFRLEAVLKIRKWKEQEALRSLGAAQRKYSEIQQLRLAMQNRRDEWNKKRSAELGTKSFSVAESHAVQSFLDGCVVRERQFEHKLQHAKKQIEKALRNYLSAKKALKSIEKIKEKSFEEFKVQQRKIEAKRQDDFQTTRWDPARIAMVLLNLCLFANSIESAYATECILNASALNSYRHNLAALNKREAELKLREEEIATKEKAILDQVSKIEEAQKKFEIAKAQISAEKSAELQKLVEALDKMSPKAAAPILARTDEGLVIEALKRLQPEKVAKVLSAMEPEKSSRLSEGLAGFRKSPSGDGSTERR